MNNRNTSIQNTAKAVHNETVRIVDAQLSDMAIQLATLDGFVTRAREENGRHRIWQCESVRDLSSSVKQSYNSVDDSLQATVERMDNHTAICKDDIGCLEDSLSPFSCSIRTPLAELVTSFESNPMMEYVVTGVTPQKKEWTYPITLPRTEDRDLLLARLRDSPALKPAAARSPKKITSPKKMVSPRKGFSSPSKLPSPTKTKVFHDDPTSVGQVIRPAQLSNDPIDDFKGGLREIDMNVLAQSSPVDQVHGHSHTTFAKSTNNMQQPPLKRHATAESRLPRKGRENSVLSKSIGPGAGMGRRLRSSPQQ